MLPPRSLYNERTMAHYTLCDCMHRNTAIMRLILLSACLSGLLSSILAADVNNCYNHSRDAITYHCPYRSGGVNYPEFDLYADNIRVDTATSIKFQTKGKNDAHILLQYDRNDYNSKVIEVVLGGWSNSKSVIRDVQQGHPKAEYRSTILSESEYRWFWISWDGGIVQVGSGETVGSGTFMSWNGLAHAINGARVSYGYGSDGYFILYKSQPATTYHCPYRPGGVNYPNFDLYADNIRVDTATSIKFRTKGKNDAHILLQYDRNDYNNKVIEIVLGGWGNSKSVIRDVQQGHPKAEYRSTILSVSEFRWFWISWDGGNVQVGRGDTIGSGAFMSWNGLAHAINGIRVSYGYGSDGYFVFNQPGSTFTFPDGCDTCSCTMVYNTYQISCDSVVCKQLHCSETQTVKGDCCPTCKPGCNVDKIGFVGKGPYETEDPCEQCECVGDEQFGFHTICAMMSCSPCQFGNIPDGTCCGKCNKCPMVKCGVPPCKEKFRFQDDDMCCPDCMCRYEGELVKPSHVGDKCDRCICADGEITCNSVCKDTTKVECVDPVRGENCCYECPNGETCRHPKKKAIVMRKDEPPQIVGKSVCMCSPDFWFPYAFCAPKKVKSSAFQGVENYTHVVAKWFRPNK